MNESLSSKGSKFEPEYQVKISDVLNFTSGIFVVLVTAILYFSGWVYIAHWYGFFGVDAAQIEIPFHTILLYGAPSILIILMCLLIALATIGIYRAFFNKAQLTVADLPLTLLLGFILIFISMEILLHLIPEYYRNIFELWLGFVSTFIVIVLVAFETPSSPDSVRLGVRLRMIARSLQKGKFKETAGLFSTSPETKEIIEMGARELIERSNERFLNFSKTWRFWIGLIFACYFLISISISAILGDWDALRAKHILVSNWQIPLVTMYSNDPIAALKSHETAVAGGYEYSNLGLLASNQQAYYLVDFKHSFPSEDYYLLAPKVYLIARPNDTPISIKVYPYSQLPFSPDDDPYGTWSQVTPQAITLSPTPAP